MNKIIKNISKALIALTFMSSFNLAQAYKPKGLNNYGSTCYANAVMQCLFNLKSLETADIVKEANTDYKTFITNNKIAQGSQDAREFLNKLLGKYKDLENNCCMQAKRTSESSIRTYHSRDIILNSLGKSPVNISHHLFPIQFLLPNNRMAEEPIKKYADTLIVFINRDNNGAPFLKTKVEFKETEQVQKQKYELSGFASYSGGHYVAYVKSENQWYFCNDNATPQATTFDNAKNNSRFIPVILFYNKTTSNIVNKITPIKITNTTKINTTTNTTTTIQKPKPQVEKCSICLDVIGTGYEGKGKDKIIMTECGHLFCKSCIEENEKILKNNTNKNLNSQIKCPECNHEYTNKIELAKRNIKYFTDIKKDIFTSKQLLGEHNKAMTEYLVLSKLENLKEQAYDAYQPTDDSVKKTIYKTRYHACNNILKELDKKQIEEKLHKATIMLNKKGFSNLELTVNNRIKDLQIKKLKKNNKNLIDENAQLKIQLLQMQTELNKLKAEHAKCNKTQPAQKQTANSIKQPTTTKTPVVVNTPTVKPPVVKPATKSNPKTNPPKPAINVQKQQAIASIKELIDKINTLFTNLFNNDKYGFISGAIQNNKRKLNNTLDKNKQHLTSKEINTYKQQMNKILLDAENKYKIDKNKALTQFDQKLQNYSNSINNNLTTPNNIQYNNIQYWANNNATIELKAIQDKFGIDSKDLGTLEGNINTLKNLVADKILQVKKANKQTEQNKAFKQLNDTIAGMTKDVNDIINKNNPNGLYQKDGAENVVKSLNFEKGYAANLTTELNKIKNKYNIPETNLAVYRNKITILENKIKNNIAKFKQEVEDAKIAAQLANARNTVPAAPAPRNAGRPTPTPVRPAAAPVVAPTPVVNAGLPKIVITNAQDKQKAQNYYSKLKKYFNTKYSNPTLYSNFLNTIKKHNTNFPSKFNTYSESNAKELAIACGLN